jgi:hypothetical protein
MRVTCRPVARLPEGGPETVNSVPEAEIYEGFGALIGASRATEQPGELSWERH